MKERDQEEIRYERFDVSNPEILNRIPLMQRKSPIFVTLCDPHITHVDVQRLIQAGMNIAKFRVSHSIKGDNIKLLGKIDKAVNNICDKYKTVDWPVACCMELKTCMVKTGMLFQDDVEFINLKTGDDVVLTNNIHEYDKCNARRIYIDNPHLTKDIQLGTEIIVNLGQIILISKTVIDDHNLKCYVQEGGKLISMSNVSVRGMKSTRPLLTKKDWQILKFAIEYQVDMVIVNYTRKAETLEKIHQIFNKNHRKPLIISAITSEECLENIDEIIQKADGIILARDYLPFEVCKSRHLKLPILQKWLGAKCLLAGKPFYISGGIFTIGLLENQIYDAEVFDVANAILEGVTGFILKECYIVENVINVITYLDEVCRQFEPLRNSPLDYWRLTFMKTVPANAAEACAMAAVALANQVNAQAIILPTVTGHTARLLVVLKPGCQVITISTCGRVTKMLQSYKSIKTMLYKGVTPKKGENPVDARINYALEISVKSGELMYGDTYVTLARGSDSSSFCDTIKIWKVTISKKPLVECSDPDDVDEVDEDIDL